MEWRAHAYRCCLYRKGKNFRANHNKLADAISGATAVAYIAKVRILEQITTNVVHLCVVSGLLLISQR